MDYKNNLFTSNNQDDIIEFYNSFQSRDDLLQWMKERPKGVACIHEIEGDTDIIVVIPTADFNGKYAKECRENIFKGLHIIFVESGEIPDLYFNGAHNVNVGIKKAMEYDPKWVVFSNDDMKNASSVANLVRELSHLDNKAVNLVLVKKSLQSATNTSIAKLNFLGLLAYLILGFTPINKVIDNKYTEFFTFIKNTRKYGNRYIIAAINDRFFAIFFKRLYSYYNFESFGIFSGRYISNKSGIFDETYVNAHEDQDVSIILSKEPTKIAWIDYGIEGIGGESLGKSLQRMLRRVASDCYFNYKIERGLLGNIESSS